MPAYSRPDRRWRLRVPPGAVVIMAAGSAWPTIKRVRALPAEIPHEISVDVTPLVDLEASLHVRDLVIPDNVHVQTDGDELIARVLPPRIEEDRHLNAARHINEAIAQLEALRAIAPEETG